MIISRKYKFICLRWCKWAGSWMEVVLNKYLGPNDIQIGSWTETLQGNGKMNKKAIKDAFFSPSTWGSLLKQIFANKLNKGSINFPKIINSQIKNRYQNILGHNPACSTAELVKCFDPIAWNNYFKFSFVRNPFDFEISDYYWRTKRIAQSISFKDFLRRKMKISSDPEHVVPFPITNWPIYSLNNKVILDHVGPFEDLNNQISLIGKRIGLPLNTIKFPIVKKGVKKNFNFRNLYDHECIEMVYSLHRHEFDYFKYNFPTIS